MDLYFRTGTLDLVNSPSYLQPLERINVVRGDTPDFVARFVDGTSRVVGDPFGASATWLFSAKLSGSYGSDPLTSTTAITRSGSGTTTAYTFAPNLNTAELNAVLGVGSGTEQAYVDLDAQLQCTLNGKITSTQKFVVRVNNDIARGDDPLTNDAGSSSILKATDIVDYGIATVPTLVIGDPSGTVIASITGDVDTSFLGNTNIKTVWGGSSATLVDLPTFGGCTEITSVSFPNVATILSPGEPEVLGAFENCTSLVTAYLPACETLGERAFNGCTALTTITLKSGCSLGTNSIPEGVTPIYV